MSVVKSKRKQSQFEVFHHLMKMRQRITDLLLRDFGYSFEKFNKKLEKRYGRKPYLAKYKKIATEEWIHGA